MSDMKQGKAIRRAIYIFLAITLGVVYFTHRNIHFMLDDIWYSTVLFDENIPIRSLGDIVQSQIWHYLNWGGRTMAHTILQLVLLTGEQWADIINMIVTLLLSGTICLVSGHRDLPTFFAATVLPLALNADWKMSMFWQSGAVNYLYMTVFILLFIFCYLREFSDEEQKTLPGIVLWILPLGILTGWSNENMGPSAWVVSTIVILYVMKKKRKVHLWMILGNLCCLLGSIVMILAPGNYVRSSEVEQYGVLWRCFLRCYCLYSAIMTYLLPVILVLLFVLFLGKVVLKIAIGKQNLLLLFCALLSWGAMIFSPHYPARSSFGTMVLLVCVILSMVGKIVKQRKELVIPLFAGLIFLWLRAMFFCLEGVSYAWGWIQ